MENLAQFARSRMATSSNPLYHIAIIDSGEALPTDASVEALESSVPVVDVRVGNKLPRYLT